MKINKQFVQEVANGKYKDYDPHGEMQHAAQRILDEKVVSKFQKFCFFIYGKEMSDHVGDIFDAFVDFELHGSEIKVEVPEGIYPTGILHISGMTMEESLEELWYTVCSDFSLYEFMSNREFKVAGEKRVFKFDTYALHYYFDKRVMSKRQLIELCRVA